jgi:transposase
MVPMELLPCSPSSPPAAPVAAPPSAHDHDRALPCAVCPRQQQLRDAQWQAAYYKAQHQRATQREQLLKQEVAQLQAERRDLQHRLFGRKSETQHTPDQLVPDDAHAGCPETAPDGSTPPADAPAPDPPPRRRRGQRRGSPGHGRRDYSHLPTTEEVSDLPPAERCCQRCGQPFAPFPGTDDSTVLEVEVKAHRRLVHRKRYRPCCDCGVHPGLVTAPPPPRLIPKSPFGISLWVSVLLDKYLFYRPTQRLLADWRSHGLDLASGSLIGGLKQLLPLFEPLYEALIQRSQQQILWHGDETRWLVFASVEGKVGYRW